QHEKISEAVVIAREQDGTKQLIAYTTGEGELEAEAIRSFAQQRLPGYMVPSAYVRLDAFPLTPNGKLDRKALPAPDEAAYVKRAYEAPQGEVEETLAQLWRELLGVEQVGRQDNFFELGGHSLMAVSLIERMRQAGLHADVRVLFTAPTLAELAGALSENSQQIDVPENLITEHTEAIHPELLPLVALSQASIDRIVAQVPGGVKNIQDIYPLAPSQEGILFHHVLDPEADAYVETGLFAFASRPRLDRFLDAVQRVIDRHDVLRTAVLWEGVEQPVQVVLRKVTLPCEVLAFEPSLGDVAEQLETRYDPRRYRLDIRTAPLMHCYIADDPRNGRWLLRLMSHHIVIDHTTQELFVAEAEAIERGREHELAKPVPFRNFVAQARLGVSEAEHEAFFTKMLGDIDEPSAPFGLLDVQGDGSNISDTHRGIDVALGARIRECVKVLGISAASLMHLAWALVVSRSTGREDAVFGTVLFGRMQGGAQADRVLGMFVNTLPIRVTVDDLGVEAALRRTHEALAQLLGHEHAPLALAQRCSGVDAPAPLFTSLLNYRYSGGGGEAAQTSSEAAENDIRVLGASERTNYPLTVSIDDYGDEFSISAQAISPLDADRICDYLVCAIERVTDALAHSPRSPVGRIDILPAPERHQVLVSWNATDRPYPRDMGVHTLFEAQALAQPEAVAVIDEAQQLS
ncbi:condensation domain-containing protein, partial [Denitromonas iodatirespirans]